MVSGAVTTPSQLIVSPLWMMVLMWMTSRLFSLAKVPIMRSPATGPESACSTTGLAWSELSASTGWAKTPRPAGTRIWPAAADRAETGSAGSGSRDRAPAGALSLIVPSSRSESPWVGGSTMSVRGARPPHCENRSPICLL